MAEWRDRERHRVMKRFRAVNRRLHGNHRSPCWMWHQQKHTNFADFNDTANALIPLLDVDSTEVPIGFSEDDELLVDFIEL